MTTSLAPCDHCVDGYLVTYCTRRVGSTGLAKRFLKCNVCGMTAAEVVPARRTRVPDLVRSSRDRSGDAAFNARQRNTQS